VSAVFHPDLLAAQVAIVSDGGSVSGAALTVDGAIDNYLGPWPPADGVGAEGELQAEARRA
jgi:hypothetical protein